MKRGRWGFIRVEVSSRAVPLRRLTLALTAFILLFALSASCSGKPAKSHREAGSGTTALAPAFPAPNAHSEDAAGAKSLEEIVAQVKAYEAPDGVDSATFELLRDALVKALREQDVERSASRMADRYSSNVNDLVYHSDNQTITFDYRNDGDYDGSGEAGVADITPIAQHYLHKKNTQGEFPDEQDAFIDGDGDGVVGISDIIAIAINFLGRVDGYAVIACDRIENGFREIKRVALSAGGAGLPKRFTVDVSDIDDRYIAVAAYVDNPYERMIGALSNVVDTTGGASPIPYPRLGMWFPNFERNTVAEAALYDVVIMNASDPHVAAMREANPDIVILNYTAFSESNPGPNDNGEYNPWLKDWPDEWFLTEAGTTLESAIDDTQTEIVVADWTKSGPAQDGMPTTWDIFHIDGDISCDGEIMTVTDVNDATRTLTVERARYGRNGGAHSAGARIAPIARFWPGTLIMNLTSDCPTAQLHGAAAPETFAQYYFRMCRDGAPWFDEYNADLDGFLFDRMEDEESFLMWGTANSIDVNRDNAADEFVDFDAVWLQGIKDITAMVRAGYPSAPILRNLGGGRRFADYNGNHFESWPQYNWDEWPGRTAAWHWEMFGVDESFPIEWVDIFGGIAEWASISPEPNFTWVETYEDEGMPDSDGDGVYDNPFDKPGFVPNYQKMRWGLTSALLCGAYFSYEINTNGHGELGLMWFDEYGRKSKYDDAEARGYLGYPMGDIYTLFAEPGTGNAEGITVGVWAREFTNGLVICNPLDNAVEVQLPVERYWQISGTPSFDIKYGIFKTGNITVPAYDGVILKKSW